MCGGAERGGVIGEWSVAVWRIYGVVLGGQSMGRVQCIVCVARMCSKAQTGYRCPDTEHEQEAAEHGRAGMERANVPSWVDGGQVLGRSSPRRVSGDGDAKEASVRCGWVSHGCVPQVRNGQVCMGT